MTATADETKRAGPSRGSRFWAGLAQISLPLGAFLYVALVLFRWPGAPRPLRSPSGGRGLRFPAGRGVSVLVYGAVLVVALSLAPDAANGSMSLGWFALYMVWFVGVWMFADPRNRPRGSRPRSRLSEHLAHPPRPRVATSALEAGYLQLERGGGTGGSTAPTNHRGSGHRCRMARDGDASVGSRCRTRGRAAGTVPE